MKHLKLLATSVALTIGSMIGAAQSGYPERPIQFVVPWPPGDLEDTITRMIAKRAQEELGVPTSTVNIKGGAALIGATHVANAPADGYTIGAFTANVVSAHIIKGNATYGRDRFEPLGIMIGYPMMLITRSDMPFDDLESLAAFAKENLLSLGVYGLNGPPARQTLKTAERLDFEYGSVTAFDEMSCLMLSNGELDILLGGNLLKSCLDSGEAKAVAAYTTERIKIYPNVPTLEEQVPGISTPGWAGLFVRSGTPQEARDAITKIAIEVVNSPEAQAIATNTGAVINWMPVEEAVPFIKQFYERFETLLAN